MIKKFIIIASLLFLPISSYAQVVDLNALQAIQNRNDNARDYAIQQNIEHQKYLENQEQKRQNQIANSISIQNKAKAEAIRENSKFNSENRQIDLEERKLQLHHDQVKSDHAEDFVKGELERQKAINDQIKQGTVQLNINSVNAD